MKEHIYSQLQSIISGITDKEVSFQLTTPENPEHGDYSTNAALVLSKLLGRSPRGVAENIALEIRNLKLEIIDKVDIAGPGFVNFFISKDALFESLNTILEQQKMFGRSDRLSGKKVITEFTDPNPFKEFHIGNKYFSDGKLRVTFDEPEESKLNWRKKSKVCDIWLLKQ